MILILCVIRLVNGLINYFSP